MPGSPASRVIPPGTTPPPNTLSSSLFEEENRGTSSPVISFNATGTAGSLAPERQLEVDDLLRVNFSSFSVFHELQAGHLPIHFADSYPQFVQKKVVFSFAKVLFMHL
jgi:hypothetical protein